MLAALGLHRHCAGRRRQGTRPRCRPRDILHARPRSRSCSKPRDPVLYFVQRLRDEAHRFAIGSHRVRRRRDIREAGLQEIAGIGPTPQARAAASFRDAEGDRARVARRSGQSSRDQRRDGAQDLRFLPRARRMTAGGKTRVEGQDRHAVAKAGSRHIYVWNGCCMSRHVRARGMSGSGRWGRREQPV